MAIATNLVGGTGENDEAYSEQDHESGNSDEWKVYAVRTDSEGQLIWQTVYGDEPNSGDNRAKALTFTQSGRIVLFTETESAGTMAGSNFGFMKLVPATR